MKKTLYLMRHGQTLFNLRRKMQGHCDSPLTPLGVKQAEIAGKYFENINIDHAYSSTLERCCDTLEIVTGGKIPYERLKGLKEMNFGKYEGCLINELLNDPIYNRLWNLPDDDVSTPGGETYHEVQMRLKDFFNDIYKKHHDDTIFITIHGMLFIILHGIMLNYKTSELTKINKYVVRGCSLSEVEYDGKEFKIKYIDDDSHLKSSEIITYK